MHTLDINASPSRIVGDLKLLDLEWLGHRRRAGAESRVPARGGRAAAKIKLKATLASVVPRRAGPVSMRITS